ncbi:MAG: hypothetical protein ACQEQV_03880 [Fibrobacterota bacterium]
MRFTDYIRKLKPSVVFARLLDDSSVTVLSEGVFSSIAEKFCSSDAVLTRIKPLSPEAKKLLTAVYLSSGGFSAEEIDPALRSALLSRFLVCEAWRSGESRLFPFDEMIPAVIRMWQGDSLSAEQQSAGLAFAPRAYLRDSALICGYIRAESGIELKKDGGFRKALADYIERTTALGKLFSLCEPLGISTDDLLHVLMQHLKYAGIIYSESRTLYFRQWREISARQGLASLNGFIRPECLPDSAVQLCVDTENFSAPGRAALLLAAWLGLYEVAVGPQQGQLCLKRMESTPEAPVIGAGRVMPDFSVLIPAEIEPAALLEFFHCGEMIRFDMIYHGRIERYRILNAVSRGVDPDSIIAFLRQWEAPENICTTVSDWIRLFERAFLRGDLLGIRADAADQLLAMDDIRDNVHEITGYRLFYVHRDAHRRIARRLEEAGLDLRFPRFFADPVAGAENSRPGSLHQEEGWVITADPPLSGEDDSSGSTSIYSPDMKKRSRRDIVRLIKYARLMEEYLLIQYREGETKKYLRICPLEYGGDNDNIVESKDEYGAVKRIDLSKIEKIGVEENDR